MKYHIYIENRMVAEVEGIDFAWEAYRKTCELADLLGEIANLVDGETGEVIQSSDGWSGFEPEDCPPDYEMGFDPYEGCYTYDC